VEALKDIAEPVARAVHIAALREVRDAAVRAELAALRAAVARLAALPAAAE
jgi:hypothetical protein